MPKKITPEDYIFLYAFIILLTTAAFGVLGAYLLPALVPIVAATGFLLGAEIVLIAIMLLPDKYSFEREVQKEMFLIILFLGAGLGIIGMFLFKIAVPTLFAFAGPWALVMLGVLGVIAGLTAVGAIFLSAALLGLEGAFDKLALLQPFKWLGKVFGISELEKAVELEVDRESEKEASKIGTKEIEGKPEKTEAKAEPKTEPEAEAQHSPVSDPPRERPKPRRRTRVKERDDSRLKFVERPDEVHSSSIGFEQERTTRPLLGPQGDPTEEPKAGKVAKSASSKP